MDVEAVEFEDWEVLPKSDDAALVVFSSSTSVSVVLDSAPTNFDVAEPEGTLKSDYFSLDNHSRYAKNVVQGYVDKESSVGSDNPSRIDPSVVEDRYVNKISAEFRSDSGSARPEERNLGDSNASKELGLDEIVNSRIGLGEIEGGNGTSEASSFDSESEVSDLNFVHELDLVEKPKSVVGFEEKSEFRRWDENSERVLCDMVIADGNYAKTLGMSNDLDGGSQVQGGGGCGTGEQSLAVEEVNLDVKSCRKEVKIRIAWWKVPFEVLKYCVYRVSPLWSFSVAAAFVGFIFFGRTLYKMKKKSPGLQVKVTMDDKKVSLFKSHAARLNEAFSVARRVPITRLSLPIARDSPLPMISLR